MCGLLTSDGPSVCAISLSQKVTENDNSEDKLLLYTHLLLMVLPSTQTSYMLFRGVFQRKQNKKYIQRQTDKNLSSTAGERKAIERLYVTLCVGMLALGGGETPK